MLIYFCMFRDWSHVQARELTVTREGGGGGRKAGLGGGGGGKGREERGRVTSRNFWWDVWPAS